MHSQPTDPSLDIDEQEAADVSKIADMSQKPAFLDVADLEWLRKHPEVIERFHVEHTPLLLFSVFPPGKGVPSFRGQSCRLQLKT